MTHRQAAVPMLSYEDVGAACSWLATAFEFRELEDQRYVDDDGRVTHAELDVGGAAVMLGWPGPEYMSPAHHADVCQHAKAWDATPYIIDGVLVQVDDVDAHCERARAAGATILREPKDEPYGRLYNVADVEGHRWMFQRPSD
jgi:PhnB protein